MAIAEMDLDLVRLNGEALRPDPREVAETETVVPVKSATIDRGLQFEISRLVAEGGISREGE